MREKNETEIGRTPVRNGFRCEAAMAKGKGEPTVTPSRFQAQEIGETVDYTMV